MSETDRAGMTESELEAIESRLNAPYDATYPAVLREIERRSDVGSLLSEVRRLRAERAGWKKSVDEWRSLALMREDAHTEGYREGRALAEHAQPEELHQLRSEREMWQADKQVFDARAAECRQLRFERDDLRIRVNQLLGDLDRDAEEWLPYMREAAEKDSRLDAAARGLMYEQMTSLVPPYGWSRDFGRSEWDRLTEPQREAWRARARERQGADE